MIHEICENVRSRPVGHALCGGNVVTSACVSIPDGAFAGWHQPQEHGDRTASQGVPTQPWRARLLDNSQWAVGDEDLSCHR
jgi:hypothetical protein